MSRNKASIVAVMGASGSGKSLYIKGELAKAKPSRLVIWDPQHEYGAFGSPVRHLGGALELMRAARFAVVFIPSGDPKVASRQFDILCQLCYAAGNLMLVAEELAFVTSASYAPAGWAMATLKGRHKGLRIFGASQRPASIDKHFFGNATRIRTGRLNFARDIAVLADVLQVERDRVQALKPLDWIERDMATGKVTAGTLKP